MGDVVWERDPRGLGACDREEAPEGTERMKVENNSNDRASL